MTHTNVEPMNKPTRIRDFDKAAQKKARRFKKPNIENGKRSFLMDSQKAVQE
jgi:hypothetical protein